MKPTNIKLRRRAERIIAAVTGCDDATAARALTENGDDIKRAVDALEGK